MTWLNDPNHPFAGIAQKLERANENILNLHTEISEFFERCKYPVIPDVNSPEWKDAVDYHKQLVVPLYGSVLCGEIVHHLRSCLDHVIWHFSSGAYRIEAENSIEFPVLRKEPVTKDEIRRYKRKIGGIANVNVVSLIEGMQPYKRGSSLEDDLLLIVHDMDRFDKHRELAIVTTCANVLISSDIGIDAAVAITKHSQGELLTQTEMSLSRTTIYQSSKVFPQIAFAQFGQRKTAPVIPSLKQLLTDIYERVDLFAREI